MLPFSEADVTGTVAASHVFVPESSLPSLENKYDGHNQHEMKQFVGKDRNKR